MFGARNTSEAKLVTETKSRLDYHLYFKEVTELLDQLHKREEKIKVDAAAKGEDSVDGKKYKAIFELRAKLDTLIATFNQHTQKSRKEEIDDALQLIGALQTELITAARVEKLTLNAPRNNYRKNANTALNYVGKVAAIGAFFYKPLTLFQGVIAYMGAESVTELVADQTGLSDKRATSMQIIDNLIEKLKDIEFKLDMERIRSAAHAISNRPTSL